MLPPSGGRAERRGRYGRVEGLKVLPPSGGRAERRGRYGRVEGLKVLPPSGGRAERRGRYGRVEGLKVLPPSRGASGAEGGKEHVFFASVVLSSAVWIDGRMLWFKAVVGLFYGSAFCRPA